MVMKRLLFTILVLVSAIGALPASAAAAAGEAAGPPATRRNKLASLARWLADSGLARLPRLR
jgi:hypothetical protein